jgi:hypothetical protein
MLNPATTPAIVPGKNYTTGVALVEALCLGVITWWAFSPRPPMEL